MTHQGTMELACARAHASRKQWSALALWCDARTSDERAAAEHDARTAQAELGALPSLIPPDAIPRLKAAGRW